jgi:TolA-binding protein
MQIDEKEEALTYFKSFDKSSDIISAAAYAAEASIYEDTKQDYQKAAELYERAGTVYPNVLTAPEYLRKAARNYEELGQYAAAKRIYESIADRYPDSGVASGIDVYLTRLEMLQAGSSD